MIGAMIATIASVGTVCPELTMSVTSGRNSRNSARVTMMPRARPMATVMIEEISTSVRCCPARLMTVFEL